MIDLFRWGFVAAMVSTWLAIGVGAMMLLIPVRPQERQSAGTLDQKRAA